MTKETPKQWEDRYYGKPDGWITYEPNNRARHIAYFFLMAGLMMILVIVTKGL